MVAQSAINRPIWSHWMQPTLRDMNYAPLLRDPCSNVFSWKFWKSFWIENLALARFWKALLLPRLSVSLSVLFSNLLQPIQLFPFEINFAQKAFSHLVASHCILIKLLWLMFSFLSAFSNYLLYLWFTFHQCDQIWRNFTNLPKSSTYLAIFWEHI